MIANDWILFSLILIIFTMGLSLTVEDFTRLLKTPKSVAIGLTGQLLMLPALALAVGWLFQLDPILMFGLLLLACCPGGITSNLSTHLAGGDRALSVTLTSISSLSAVFTLPLIMAVAASFLGSEQHPIELPLWETAKKIFLLTVLPVSAGMVAQLYLGRYRERVQKLFSALASVVFAVLIVLVWSAQWETIVASAKQVGPATIALNVGAMLCGIVIGRLAALPQPQRITIGLEVGLQNAAMAVALAASVLGDLSYAVPASIYAVVMVLSAILFIIVARLRTPAAAMDVA